MSKAKEMIQAASKVNLCTYFILPLCLVDHTRFGGRENFLNSYLSIDGKYIHVEVRHAIKRSDLKYDLLILDRDRTFYRFEIHPQWSSDVKLFMEGKYSKMSERAKRRIREGSTLQYRVYKGTVPHTDFRLLALSNSESIRRMWEELIFDDVDIARKSELGPELLSIPGEESYISF